VWATRSELGSDLLIRVGHPEDVLPDLAPPGSKVFAQAEVASEETSVEARLRRRLGGNAPLDLVWGSTLYHRDDLPMSIDAVPDVFTPFRSAVEKKCRIRPALPSPRRVRTEGGRCVFADC
jgi:deoxyribodipyrimidine photo-lyase